ncbi:hypothetical protein BCR34DRAFT_239230 [Clohesyomyces aquaticus]|uniref:T6SS Phospholipase effector Tle1-like catalytic domain-containing protein n=1 Tax=Clohesyomyces aquaticus TaxID=1231657 RepID=A0A1Y1ZVV3_9PLEO|nr:hypothetical protein BCR34DRAFT_239230 [Clohesyomyces aquaticus]
MSLAPSTAMAPSRTSPRMSAPIVVDLPPRNPPPIVVDVPGLSGGRGMFKRLIVACDGTWLNSDNGLVNGKISVPSNVTRLSRAIKPVSQDGIPQIVYYHFGVGTQGGIVDRVVGGTVGEGLGDAVREGYSFLANNYHPGDEIFLLGFSRGAFTARSIGGLIGEIGLLTKKGLPALPEIFKDVQHRRDPKYVPKNPSVPFPNKPSASSPRYADELERRGMTRLDIPIRAIGVFDTVGSLGAPRVGWLTKVGLQSSESKENSFYDTKLSHCVENAFQALALDEKRSAFSPAIWEKPEGNKTTLRQVWFPGVHSNVGGGYDDQQLANITLAWMMSQLEPFLDMRDEYLLDEDHENDKYYKKTRQEVRPWSFGEIYNSMTGLYAIGGGQHRTPGLYHAVDPINGRTTARPLRLTNEYIHPSVRTRIRLNGPDVSDKSTYACRALTDNYKLVVDYGSRTSKSGDPDVFWKLKFKDSDAVKVLPEAPLWRLERELAKRDPETYDYVRKPPATGGSSRKKKERPRSAGSYIGPVAGGGRSRSRGPPNGKERATSRVRSLDRETDIRESMPHRREKDRAWWEAEREAERAAEKKARRNSGVR